MALVGNLQDLKLPNLIQLNCLEKNCARLTIQTRQGKGLIYFDNGQIVHAELGSLKGEKAVFELLTLKEGMFRVENDIKATEKTVFNNWSNLLLDSLRAIDEEKHTDAGQLGDLVDTMLAIKGVMEVEVLNEQGDILKSSINSKEREGYSFLMVFSHKEGQMLAQSLGQGSIHFINIKTPKSKIVCYKIKDKYVVIEYDPKIQIENLVPELNKYVQ